MTISEAVPLYLDYLDSTARRSPLTIRAYRQDLQRFLAFLHAERQLQLAQVETLTVERWMASMRDLSTATVCRALNSLSGLFKWAIRFRNAQANPLDLIERPRQRRQVQPSPTPEEVQAMLDATRNLTERVALLSMATSGLRRSEALALQ
jgi:integrase/recombinase XerD